MFANTNDYLTGRKPAPFPAGGEVVAVRAEVALTTADLALNDAGSVAILPAGCVPVSIVMDSDDLDSNATPAIVAAVGFMNTGDTDLDTTLVSGVTICQTGGSTPVYSKELMRVAAASSDRKVGVKFTTAAATAQAGTLGLTLFYRAA